MRAGGGWDALRLLLIATACGLVFALLNLPDFRARAPGTGESPLPPVAEPGCQSRVISANLIWGRGFRDGLIWWVLGWTLTATASRVRGGALLAGGERERVRVGGFGARLSVEQGRVREARRLSVVTEEIDGQTDEIAAEEDERISKSPPDTKEKIWMMQDQLIMAKAYLNFASQQGSAHLVRELKLRVKEIGRAISHSSGGSHVSGSVLASAVVVNSTVATAKGKRRRLWKAGSLPLGQLVFYNQTVSLDTTDGMFKDLATTQA
ncbi:hypothetical protein PR202_ga22026 [Eleusine coracana subsp. coracana]|uniref:Hexosyltransferase n=1 Tax=Eleusine coracana subsp. coracana TaxID=191504 RepID=A0AAV5D2G4_ELECO|nr:hypothetical protein PR202_ga22026 [Eleusine coracana subsp. coracana]